MQKQFLTIDGSIGEGGGQILRTALSLSMLTNTPIHLVNIRAGRKKSGLMRQHLVCVQASQKICNAEVIGDTLGSGELFFTPKAICAGDYEFHIGSAGSTMLVFQTLLPALLLQNQSSTISLYGGTHNPLAPTADFIAHAFIPALTKMGVKIDFELLKAGFTPIGGGAVKINIHAWQNRLPFILKETGDIKAINAYAGCLNLNDDIANRELSVLKDAFEFNECRLYHLTGNSQGNSVFVDIEFDNHRQAFTALGEIKKSAEKVANDLAKSVKQYLASKAVADEYLTDQLLLPMALCAVKTGNGGAFTAQVISKHTETQAMMIEKFLPVDITFEKAENGVLVRVNQEIGQL